MVIENIDHLQSKIKEDLKKIKQRDLMAKIKVALALRSGLKGRVMVRSEEMAERRTSEDSGSPLPRCSELNDRQAD